MTTRVALITTDKRESFRDYGQAMPSFGTAVEAILPALSRLKDFEFHIISCYQKPVQSPPKLYDNILFHGLHVPRRGWLRSLYSGCRRAIKRKLLEIEPDVVHGNGTRMRAGRSHVRLSQRHYNPRKHAVNFTGLQRPADVVFMASGPA